MLAKTYAAAAKAENSAMSSISASHMLSAGEVQLVLLRTKTNIRLWLNVLLEDYQISLAVRSDQRQWECSLRVGNS